MAKKIFLYSYMHIICLWYMYTFYSFIVSYFINKRFQIFDKT
jgi:hypothetical protein